MLENTANRGGHVGFLSEKQKNALKEEFGTYKNNRKKYSITYESRKKQTVFCNFAKRLIKLVCESSKTTRKDLMSILIITRAEAKPETIKQQILNLNINEVDKRSLINEAEYLAKQGIGGYVRYPKLSISEELDVDYIKSFLLELIKQEAEEKQKGLMTKLDQSKIKWFWPTYLPSWLHYVNPNLFPIVAKVNRNVLQKYGLDNDILSYPKVVDLFKEILDVINEQNMGLIDSFFYPDKPLESHYEPGSLDTNSNIKKILFNKKQIILYGPPGTGKTYSTKKIAVSMVGD